MKLVRILIYEGDRNWINKTLDNNYVKELFTCDHGTIREYFPQLEIIPSPLSLSTESPFDIEEEK